MAAGAGGKAGRLQVRKAARGGWTPAKRAAFLEHLAATCNIAASARAVGMAPRGAHALKARDAVFAADWARAIEAAYETLEVRLLAYALGDAEGEAEAEADGDAEAELRGAHFDPRVAVQALGFRKRGGAAVGSGAGTLCKRVSLAELEAVLVARLDALDAQAAAVTGDA
ncbi:hypothetical protein [Sphingomonas sp. PvP018]|uniref:hypothetical protein n=1 Tax=Sphingomonas sp. PvP018 TaxID=2817852 RepID=UPI001AE3295F|nr:hypothetical protein [Sphingomonas sp. PvP018]MBP2514337.1 hypothetical protein [Sphingomonas sp. PvP018]